QDAHRPVEGLAGLEEALEAPPAFRAFCRSLREEQPELGDLPLVQWYLEPAAPLSFLRQRLQAEFTAALAAEWVWHDPLADCSFTVQSSLEIRAANARDLWALNQSAPPLLRPISRDFAVHT